jgi:hypothetical protein
MALELWVMPGVPQGAEAPVDGLRRATVDDLLAHPLVRDAVEDDGTLAEDEDGCFEDGEADEVECPRCHATAEHCPACGGTGAVSSRIEDLIEIWMIYDGEGTRGWVLTVGLARLGLPELEVRGLPRFLMRSAGGMLNAVADYMLHGEPVAAGENMIMGDNPAFKFVQADPIPGQEQFYRDVRLLIVDDEDNPPECVVCAAGPHESHH